MTDLNSVLQGIKDTIQETPKETSLKPKKNHKKSKSNAFSKKELDDLEKEFLGNDAFYEEPIFVDNSMASSSIKKVLKESFKVDNSELLTLIGELKKTIEKLDKKITLNSHTTEHNELRIDEASQPLEIIKLLVSETEIVGSVSYQLQTKEGIKEINLCDYYEMSKFIAMLKQYQYSFVVDKKVTFLNPKHTQYKDFLMIISQNILANSFRFFERNDILLRTVLLGQVLKKEESFVKQGVDVLESIFVEMNVALGLVKYEKDFYFARFLNERGFILNSVTIINEMIAEYLVLSTRNFSPKIEEKIQNHLDKIELQRSTRKAYYKFYKSVKAFFISHFFEENSTPTTFFPFKTNGNSEIATEMMKLYRANKKSKKIYFIAYCELMERVRNLRNDLAHGNNVKTYTNITQEIKEILVDFNYLAMQKDFLKV